MAVGQVEGVSWQGAPMCLGAGERSNPRSDLLLEPGGNVWLADDPNNVEEIGDCGLVCLLGLPQGEEAVGGAGTGVVEVQVTTQA